ncbi:MULTISPECIES: hypothetical protein [Micromonospora]|uniref:Four helix bundle protein n=1 Tax=Micromonospora solifontis TaxID=2487138 RepID=A0ABX9WF25_9ACTN|nr:MULTISPECIES: hypothetical protein [Micromonospora]NES16692.1 hypothetical protein [Micromonospora sp. PPF5-17B]NES37360.1 hypothetical protein [Micromonospora solifontis]NES56752.1 hypothetical protein [Micromonospora sp. PPF5-6]RNL98471.1 hypothetical protein EFE23_14505 [Micromonospora solifontis]
MRQLTDETVLAVGRLTLAATELEYLLAGIGADQADADPAAIFTASGEPVRAARRSAQLASPDRRDEFVGLVEAAATYLAQSRSAVRAMWFESNRVSAATFDEISSLILRCRDRLQTVVDEVSPTLSAPPRPR